MKIGLHDADKTDFPNLALMKISAWHKAHGDTVEWWTPLCEYDKVYSSKVFSWTRVDPYLPPNTVFGGTGYGLMDELPEEVDNIFPDYSIYPDVDYAIGYLTRGCIRNCPWCVVPRKEGHIRPYAKWQDIKRPDSRDIVFMDNNVLACEHGIEQIRDMIGKNVRVDFNQALDARLITPEIAVILAGLKWIRFIRMACDTDDMIHVVLEKAKLLERNGVKPYRIFVYVLTKDIPSAERRVYALRDAGLQPFAQPYRDFITGIPDIEAAKFARYVNRKWIFKSIPSYDDYKRR